MPHRKFVTVLLIALLLIAAGWSLRSFSPYQICLRHAAAEGAKAGMPPESAEDYAERLCTSKIPLVD